MPEPELIPQVRLDGYSKREWVTDEDEWEWVEAIASAATAHGPKPVEFVLGGASFRETLTRLTIASGRRLTPYPIASNLTITTLTHARASASHVRIRIRITCSR